MLMPCYAKGMMNPEFLNMLCCPITKSGLKLLEETQLALVNQQIAQGQVKTHSGETLTAPLMAALITENNAFLYKIDQNIPVMLPDQSIPADQIVGLN